MAEFEFNLIKDVVLPPRKRKTLFYFMALYLAVTGIALVAVSHKGTLQLLTASRLRAKTTDLEGQFRERYPEHDDILLYAGTLNTDMTTYAEKLDSLSAIINRQTDLSEILVGLMQPLPRDIRIIHFDLNSKKKSLVFDVIVPIRRQEGRINARQLIERWAGDPALMSQLDKIETIMSQRHAIDGRPAHVLRFSGQLSRRKV